MTDAPTPPERSRRSLATGILVFRWVWLGWMTMLAATSDELLVRPALAWATVAGVAAWTIWLTATREWSATILVVDLLVCSWLIIASGLVVVEGGVVATRPFFATGYPLSAALVWGAAGGPWVGVGAGIALGTAQLLSRPINGVALSELTQPQWQNLAGSMVNYVVAGVAIGLVARFLVRSEKAVQQANEALVTERERAARLAERESLARQIHDSTLQALAYVHKRGRELAALDEIPASEVADLAALAERHEADLRGLIMREPADAPTGAASLRDILEIAARDIQGLEVTVSTVGPIWVERATAEELGAAVRQALDNVVEHAGASRASVFADEEDRRVSVSIRDDGGGFLYDEEHLKRNAKAGLLKSIKGRVEELGGTFSIISAPGQGTEIELKVPKETA